jgi:hypothetical protein
MKHLKNFENTDYNEEDAKYQQKMESDLMHHIRIVSNPIKLLETIKQYPDYNYSRHGFTVIFNLIHYIIHRANSTAYKDYIPTYEICLHYILDNHQIDKIKLINTAINIYENSPVNQKRYGIEASEKFINYLVNNRPEFSKLKNIRQQLTQLNKLDYLENINYNEEEYQSEVEITLIDFIKIYNRPKSLLTYIKQHPNYNHYK